MKHCTMLINFISILEHKPSSQNSLIKFVIMCSLFSSSIYPALCAQWPQIPRLRIATWKRSHSIYSQRWGSPCADAPSNNTFTRSFSDWFTTYVKRGDVLNSLEPNRIVSHQVGKVSEIACAAGSVGDIEKLSLYSLTGRDLEIICVTPLHVTVAYCSPREAVKLPGFLLST